MAVPALLLAAAVQTWAVDGGTEGALVEDHRAAAVSIVVELPVGRFSTWAREHHAAEAFEMMDRDPDGSLRKRADALAAELTLTMTSRAATLRVSCLKTSLPGVLALVRDVLGNPRFDADELTRARHEQAILWRGRDTDISFRVRQRAARGLFVEGDPRLYPYEKPLAIVTDAKRLAATRDAMVRIPGRLVGLAGDITAQEAHDAAAGLLPPPAAEAPADLAPHYRPLVAPPVDAGGADVPMRRLTQVYLLAARDSIPWGDPRRPAFEIADHVLAGHFYARLWVALRHEGGDTYGVGTIDEGGRVPGLYGAATYTRLANAAAIEAKLREAMRAFRDGGIDETERADAIGYLTGRIAFTRQSPDQILARYLTERRLGLPRGALDDLVARAGRLTLQEVNAFIGDYYDPARFTMIRAVPK